MILSGAIFDFDKLNSVVSSKDKVPIIADMMASRWAFEAISVSQFKDNFFEKNFYKYEKAESEATYKNVYYIPKLKELLNESRDNLLKEAHPSDTLKEAAYKDLEVLYTEIEKESKLITNISASKILETNGKPFTPEIYNSMDMYLSAIKNVYQEKYNKINYAKDIELGKHNSTPAKTKNFNKIKDNYYNETLGDAVMNADSKQKVILYKGNLVQKIDPIFETPKPKHSLDYRSHFYSPSKHFAGVFYDTFWFNLILIWIGSMILYITLYFETLRWVITKFENINFLKKN